MPPLSFAVSVWRQGQDTEEQKIEVVRTLIKAGAPLDLTNDIGATALDDAVAGGKVKLAAFLREQGVPGFMTGGFGATTDDLIGRVVAQMNQGPGHRPPPPPPPPPSSPLVTGFILLSLFAIVGWFVWPLLAARMSPAAATTASPTAAATSLPLGQRYLRDAQSALAAKKYRDAGVCGELAVDVFTHENGTAADKIAAHKVAGQAYYKLKEYPKAVTHYQALKALEPGNKQYTAILAELSAHHDK